MCRPGHSGLGHGLDWGEGEGERGQYVCDLTANDNNRIRNAVTRKHSKISCASVVFHVFIFRIVFNIVVFKNDVSFFQQDFKTHT